MSYHHDYYADPTLFDRCHALLADHARRLLQRTRPYYWGWGFALVASLCYLSVALIVAEMAVAGAAVAVGAAAWPQSLASSIGALMALGGGTFFQRLARAALPAPPGAKPRKAAAPAPRPRPAATAPGRAEVQQFFREVRAAGVNVSIARALFAAGIRTVAQVRGCDDRELLRIHGVGPATVRRLRARFNRPA